MRTKGAATCKPRLRLFDAAEVAQHCYWEAIINRQYTEAYQGKQMLALVLHKTARGHDDELVAIDQLMPKVS
jgi:hypothetical protein